MDYWKLNLRIINLNNYQMKTIDECIEFVKRNIEIKQIVISEKTKKLQAFPVVDQSHYIHLAIEKQRLEYFQTIYSHLLKIK